MAKDDAPLFQERLRKHFRWVFIALALIFAGSFVLGGVGGGGVGIIDLLQQNGGGDDNAATTVSAATTTELAKAAAAAQADPKSADAWTTLAEAAIAGNDAKKAREAALKAQALVGDDADVAERLANVWIGLLQDVQQRETDLQSELFKPLQNAQTGPSTTVVPLGNLGQSDAFARGYDDVSSSVQTRYFARIAPLQNESDEAQKNALASYRIVVTVRPDDPAAWYQLGALAQALGENDQAIEAYTKFLAIVPGDPEAPDVQKQLDSLQPATTAADTAASTAADAATADAGSTDAATTG